MRLSDRTFEYAPFIIATVLIAGVVHIVSVLLTPLVAPRDALARLSEAAKTAEIANGGVALLAAPEPGRETLPFEDPAFAEGVCVFDLTKGMLRVRASADGEDFLGLSFHADGGRVFHAMTDHSAIKGRIDIVVGDTRQIAALEEEEAGEAPVQEVRLTAPTKRGFVLLRSLAKRPSDQERARRRLQTVACESFEPSKEEQ